MTVTAPLRPPPRICRPRTWRSVILLSVGTVLAVAPFGMGILVPYYANGLDALPLAELTSGAHDPKDLPRPAGVLGGLVAVSAGLALAFSPMALIGLAAFGGMAVVQEWITFPAARRARRTVAAALGAITTVHLALVYLLATPTASALVTWRLD